MDSLFFGVESCFFGGCWPKQQTMYATDKNDSDGMLECSCSIPLKVNRSTIITLVTFDFDVMPNMHPTTPLRLPHLPYIKRSSRSFQQFNLIKLDALNTVDAGSTVNFDSLFAAGEPLSRVFNNGGRLFWHVQHLFCTMTTYSSDISLSTRQRRCLLMRFSWCYFFTASTGTLEYRLVHVKKKQSFSPANAAPNIQSQGEYLVSYSDPHDQWKRVRG